MRDALLDTIDSVLDASDEVLQQSQEESGSSSRYVNPDPCLDFIANTLREGKLHDCINYNVHNVMCNA